MRSKHLIQEDGTSHAVDLMAYDGSNPSWDIVMYDDIADAMKILGKRNWSYNSLGSVMEY